MCDLTGARPLYVGVAGNSIARGVGVQRKSASWPSLLQKRLRLRFGNQDIWVVNGAVRASSADFAALCWEAIWSSAQPVPLPHSRSLSMLIMDYSLTSSFEEQHALLERALHERVPALGLVYCLDKLSQGASRQKCETFHDRLVKLYRRQEVPFATITSNQSAFNAFGTNAHPNEIGHQMMAAHAERLVVDFCLRRAAAVLQQPPSNYPAQSCHIGTQSLRSLVVARRGFRDYLPDSLRLTGLVADEPHASVTLRLPLGSASSGYVLVGHEQSWRNAGVATLSCLAPCHCQPARLLLNLSSSRYDSVQHFSAPLVMAHAAQSIGGTRKGTGLKLSPLACNLDVRLRSLERGRALLSAITFTAPRHGCAPDRDLGAELLPRLAAGQRQSAGRLSTQPQSRCGGINNIMAMGNALAQSMMDRHTFFGSPKQRHR